MASITLTKKIDRMVDVDSMHDEDLSCKVFDVMHVFGAKYETLHSENPLRDETLCPLRDKTLHRINCNGRSPDAYGSFLEVRPRETARPNRAGDEPESDSGTATEQPHIKPSRGCKPLSMDGLEE
ncbi:hypothetical protein C1H46_032644 [Malus baccata]|uniref:Uncharacterized protein n=1 Tax=Malus baccata TaxID=106549 RepID=A0A540L5N5_MALBA|nr:hypothetical protein C1H46_032644 [Malus baccata]